ncbi:MAG: hypothetical protein ACK5JD_05425 [Mangrovibacterium sp.]
MEANQQNSEQKKASKDIIWLLVGAVILIAGLVMIKTVMSQMGILG